VTVFPSPAGVAVIAVTSISFPFLFPSNLERTLSGISAMFFSYNIYSSSLIPISAATSAMGLTLVSSAISKSVFIAQGIVAVLFHLKVEETVENSKVKDISLILGDRGRERK